MTAKTVKTKRVLKNIDFSKDKSHIALTSTAQGGPCSGADYALVLKGSNFSQETIEKIQQIQVTMELPEFLRKFFSLYYEDSEVLAQLMGYIPPEDNYEVQDYQDYIKSKLDSFTILKSIKEADNISSVLSTLDEKQYLLMLTDQAYLEKALNKKESELVALATESDNSTHASVEKSVEVSTSKSTKSKEQNMTKEIKVDDTTKIEKSATELSLELLQKSFDESRVELQKAQELIAEFKKEKQEQIQKSKTAQFTAVIKDEKLQAPIVKAALALEAQEDFDAFLSAVTAMQSQIEKQKDFVEKSALFQEQGASTSEEPKDNESAVAKLVKSRLAANK